MRYLLSLHLRKYAQYEPFTLIMWETYYVHSSLGLDKRETLKLVKMRAEGCELDSERIQDVDILKMQFPVKSFVDDV